MKTILLSLIVLTMTLQSSFAGHTESILNIRAQSNVPIVVQINGQRQGAPAQQHKFVDLPAGINNIKVIAVNQNHNGYGGGRTILFNGTVRIKPGFITNVVVTNRNGLVIKSLVAINGYGNISVSPTLAVAHTRGFTKGPSNLYERRRNGYGYRYGRGHGQHQPPAPTCHGNIHRLGCGHNRAPVPTCHGGVHIEGCGHNIPALPTCHGDVHNDGCGHVIAPQPMHPTDFDLLMNTIANRAFDNTKLQIAKNALANNYMSANQVRQMLQLFCFESNRLEIAKFAFDSVIDQQNYYVVYDAFHFDSSIRELDRFIYG